MYRTAVDSVGSTELNATAHRPGPAPATGWPATARWPPRPHPEHGRTLGGLDLHPRPRGREYEPRFIFAATRTLGGLDLHPRACVDGGLEMGLLTTYPPAPARVDLHQYGNNNNIIISSRFRRKVTKIDNSDNVTIVNNTLHESMGRFVRTRAPWTWPPHRPHRHRPPFLTFANGRLG